MKKVVFSLLRFTAAICLFILTSCEVPKEEENRDPELVEWEDWQIDAEGFLQFFMNDPQYIRESGMAFWTTGDLVEDPMSSLRTLMKKNSGDPTMGFGVIFCVQSDRFFMVKIDAAGYYGISKIVETVESRIKDWTYTDSLQKGYGAVNAIRVDYNDTSKSFSLSFNNQFETTFSDPESPPLSSGRYGFIVGVSSEERFPEEPVDVRFKQLAP